MISKYVREALKRARFERLEDRSYVGRIPKLRGVLATGRTVAECRAQLVEVVEEWILVRVARGLEVPALGHVKIDVRRAG